MSCRLAGALAGAALMVAPAATAAPPALDGCVRPGPGVRLVAFRAGPADVVRAAVLGRGATGVVLSNQSDRDLCAWLPFARMLTRAGYRVLLYDEGGLRPWTETAAAARALRRLGVRRVELVGASEGAKSSIMAAAGGAPADALVSLSAERHFRDGTDVLPAAARLTVPILFVAARNDPWSELDTPALYRACGSHRKSLLLVAGGAHGADLLAGAGSARVRAAILAFLAARRR